MSYLLSCLIVSCLCGGTWRCSRCRRWWRNGQHQWTHPRGMLVYPAASELNTQPVHKIPFINALSLLDAFHLKFLAFSRPITPTRSRLSLCRFFFYLHICFNLFRSLHVGRIASLVSLVVIIFSFLFFFFVYRHSQKRCPFNSRCLACHNFVLPRKFTETSRENRKLSRFASRSALLTYSFVIFILMLSYLFFLFISPYLC